MKKHALLDEAIRIERELLDMDERERLLLKMFANLLESHYGVKNPQHRLKEEEYFAVPGRWELMDGMLKDY